MAKEKHYSDESDNAGQPGPPEAGHGSHEDFLRLLMTHHSRLYSYILMLTPNLADADDIFQESSLVMMRKFDQFRLGSDFLAWARRIAYYEVLRRRQNRDTRHHIFGDDLLDRIEHLTSQSVVERPDDRLDALQGCLEKLSETERGLIHMRYEQDIPMVQAAARIGITVRGCYKRMTLIHDALLRCVRRSLALGDLE